MALDLAIVIPTLNEAPNIQPLIARLRPALEGIEWELIFVDDNSPDGTASLLREYARQDLRIRVLQRPDRQGLASACIQGMFASAAPFIAVMDADLQHDETILPSMYRQIKADTGLDLVVASRNQSGGSMGKLGPARTGLSHLGVHLSRLVTPGELSDPMSGFFLISRALLDEVAPRLSGVGFKILLDIVASARRPLRFVEIPYHFRERQHGRSKLDFNVGLEYFELLLDKLVGRAIPLRYLMFVLVGAFGILVHLTALTVLYRRSGVTFVWAQAWATLTAMTFNYVINNLTTFRDRRLRGVAMLRGLLTFYLICSAGALANISFATFLLAAGLPWWAAGIPGAVVSSLWNYGVNTVLTWRRGLKESQRRHVPAHLDQRFIDIV